MKLVIFGLTVSSSWGNGHATLWRGWLRGLLGRGHRVVFYERDVPCYAGNRDLASLAELGGPPGRGTLRFYRDFDANLQAEALGELADADAAMVTSYCPDGPAAAELVLNSGAERKVFYDLDTPVTLGHLRAGEPVPYLPAGGLGDFDLVLSFTGGPALGEFFTPGREILIARTTADTLGALDLSDGELRAVAKAARERVLAEHTADVRAAQMETLLSSCGA